MLALLARLQTRLTSDDGATAVEYGLMVGLIAAVIIGVVTTLGTNVSGLFTTISTTV